MDDKTPKTVKEVWKPVKNYEGLYAISNLGRIQSCRVPHQGYGGKILIPEVIKGGRKRVYLNDGTRRKRVYLDDLVKETFEL